MSGKIGSITTDIIKNGLVFNVDAANRASYVNGNTETFNTTNLSQSGSIIQAVFDSTFIAWDFDGVDDRIQISNTTNLRPTETELNSNGYTYSVWLNLDSVSGHQGIFNNDSYGQTTYYGLGGSMYNDGFYMYKFDGGGTGAGDRSGANTSGIFSTGTWTCITAVYVNATNTNFKIYKDGISQSTSTSGTGGSVGYSSTLNASIGADRSNYLNGKIANVHIYNRALSSTEVLHNYNALKGRFGL